MSQSWKCQFCKLYARATANYCATCGRAWQEAWERQQHQPWTYTGEPQSPRRVKSPRRRPQKGAGKAQAASTAAPAPWKGRAKGEASEVPTTAAALPDISQLPVMPPQKVPAPPKSAVEGSNTEERRVLETLVTQLTSSNMTLSPEVEALVNQYRNESVGLQGKQLHQLVAKQTRSRKELTKIHNQRQQFDKVWYEYLGKLTQLVQTQLEERARTLEEFASSEEAWTKQLQEASSLLAQSTGGGRASTDEAMMDEEEDKVDQAIEAEAAQNRAREAAATQLQTLMQTLQAAQQQATENHGREGSRTPRRKKTAPQAVESSPESEPMAVDGKPGAGSTPAGGGPKDNAKADYVPECLAQLLALQCEFEDPFERMFLPKVEPDAQDLLAPKADGAGTSAVSQEFFHRLVPVEPWLDLAPVLGTTAQLVQLQLFVWPISRSVPVEPWLDLIPVLGTTAQPPQLQLAGSCRALVGPCHDSGFLDMATSPQQDILEAMETAGPAAPCTPPALLGREGPPRPHDLSKLSLHRIELLPEHLARYPVNEIPVDQLGLFALEPGHSRRVLKFSVFDRQRHHQQRTAAYGWSINDLVSEAIRTADERIKTAQILTTTMPQLAVPQIVLTPADAAINQLCVPIDLRPLGGRPCTLLLTAHMPALDVIQEAFSVCPAGPLFTPTAFDARALFLVDAQGNVWDELPLELSQLQWLRVQGRQPLDILQPERQIGPGAPARSNGTTHTTTWVMEQQNVQTVSFILAGLGITVRLHPQHVSQARVAESIADLVMAIARQKRLPPRTRVVLAAAQPMPLQIQHVAVLFIIYPDDDRKHIILDPSGDGSMAQSISIDDHARPEELLAEAQRRQEYVIAVNGIPHCAMRRHLQTGDYVQVIHGPRRHRVSPSDWYYQIYPDLRLFAFPIEIPRLQRATATPLDALVQTQVRDSFLRYLRTRLAQQNNIMGQPAATTQPVFIQGPGHAPALLYVPGRILPVLREVEPDIASTGLFQPGTTFVDSCQVTHMHAPLFLSVPPNMPAIGVFVPAPAFLMGYHLMWVTPNTDPATLPLPVHRNFDLVYPSALEHAATVRHRRVASTPPAQPRDTASGTSMACTSSRPAPRRQIIFDTVAATNIVPTPFGRRHIPRKLPDLAGNGVVTTRGPQPYPSEATLTDSPCVLCLADLLPTSAPSAGNEPERATANRAESSLVFPLPDDVDQHAFEPFALQHLESNVPRGTPLVPVAQRFLDGLRRAPDASCADALMCFVDGSFQEASSAWSVAVLGRCGHEWCWLGFRAGRVPRECSGSSVFEAELWAQLVALGTVAAANLPAVILYDSQSAAMVAHGATAGTAMCPLQSTIASIMGYIRCGVHSLQFRHIPAHKGNPGNELADGLAKYALALDANRDAFSAGLVPDVLGRHFQWLWLLRAQRYSTQWPLLNRDGCTVPCTTVQPPTIQPCPSACYGEDVPDACVLALQETRHSAPPLTVINGTIRVASEPTNGLLIVLAATDTCRLVFVVAHAPTSAAPVSERDAWWQHLTHRLEGLPPGASPVVCIDANARHVLTKGVEHPSNDNAQRLCLLASRFSLCRTHAYHPDGNMVVTWRAPLGHPACLDYVLVPDTWEEGLRTVSNLGLLDEHAGVDHEVLGAELHLRLQQPTRRPAGLNREAMLTPEGRQATAQLFASAPLSPWSSSADDHLHFLHEHLLTGARQLFPCAVNGPRRPVLSSQTWNLLHVKRWARRIHRRRQLQHRREYLWAVFCGWRNAVHGGAHRAVADCCRRRDYQVAHYIRFMQCLTSALRSSTAHDEARFSRDHLARARTQGPRAMAAAIRAVLKHGRRYKAPLPATTLRTVSGELIVDDRAVKEAFGQHFAISERATACDFGELHTVQTHIPDRVVIEALPSLTDLSAAFAGLRCGKSPGPSLLPAELFKAAPMEAALSVMPILLKSQARHCLPLLWRGVHSIALLKPNKPPDKVDSHRAIALMPCTGKAVAKACRPTLTQCFETTALASVGGSRKMVPIELPSLMVQAYLSYLERERLNGAVLFLDGVAAFPSTDRTLLFDMTEAQLQAKLQDAGVEPEVKVYYTTAFRRQGALSRAGVPSDLVRFLETSLRGTWFSVDANAEKAYATSYGTMPGAPNADVGFQFALQASLEALDCHLAAEGLSARLELAGHTGLAAPPTTWLDDIALLITSDRADTLPANVSRAASLAAQYLRILGVRTNFAAGKTEAILHLCGQGTRRVQQQCLLGCEYGPGPGLRVHLPGEADVTMRCVSKYTHLGTLRASSATTVADVQHRTGLARESLHPVRRRLLCNPNFTRPEKCQFVFSLIVSRLMHNAGTWVFPHASHYNALRKGYLSLLRGCVRPICNVPCRRLDDMQVCALLGAMLPDEALACARIRTLAAASAKGHDFLKTMLLREQAWLGAALQAVRTVATQLKSATLVDWVNQVSVDDSFPQWPLSAGATHSLLRPDYMIARRRLESTTCFLQHSGSPSSAHG
ncbi:unnamed protein product [Symbiodinium microadriaticum]|nr:unnamed protein product [Symbiodinium microadriaticum]